MLIAYLQFVTKKIFNKKHHFQDEKYKAKLKGQSKVVRHSFQQVDVASSLSKTQAILILHSFIATFTGSNITKYSGLNTAAKYMNKQGIIKSISTLFPTRWHSATKFGVHPVKFASRNKLFNRVTQVLISIIMASFCGINRINKISSFTGDGLKRVLLKLNKAINENAISATVKKLGQSGARKLQSFLLSK